MAKGNPKVIPKSTFGRSGVRLFRKMETGNWKMETGSQKMETGSRKMEIGSRKMETGGRYPVPVLQVSGDLCAESPDPPGDPSF